MQLLILGVNDFSHKISEHTNINIDNIVNITSRIVYNKSLIYNKRLLGYLYNTPYSRFKIIEA